MGTVSQELLEEVARRLVDELQPDTIILFGSHAWGAPDEGSDLDLLVILPQVQESPLRLEFRARRCLRGLGVPKDVLVRTQAQMEQLGRVPGSLEAQILDRGKVLYGMSAPIPGAAL